MEYENLAENNPEEQPFFDLRAVIEKVRKESPSPAGISYTEVAKLVLALPKDAANFLTYSGFLDNEGHHQLLKRILRAQASKEEEEEFEKSFWQEFYQWQKTDGKEQLH